MGWPDWVTQRHDSKPTVGAVCQLPEARGATSNTFQESTSLVGRAGTPPRAPGLGLLRSEGLPSHSRRRGKSPLLRPPDPRLPLGRGPQCADAGSPAPRRPPRAHPPHLRGEPLPSHPAHARARARRPGTRDTNSARSSTRQTPVRPGLRETLCESIGNRGARSREVWEISHGSCCV